MPDLRRLTPRFLPAALLALAVLAAYGGSLAGPFVFDDLPSIRQNPTLLRLRPIGPVLSPPRGMTVDGRPLLNLSLALNYALGGFDTRGYHAVNLAIHILAAATLFGIVRRTGWRLAARSAEGERGPWSVGPDLVALAAAIVWALHPLQTEAVSYVIQRAESMMGLFYLLTLYCFIRFADPGGESGGREAAAGGSPAPRRWQRAWPVLSVLSCFLGMATKEVMVSAPVMVALYDRIFLAGSWTEAWRRRKRIFLALGSSWILLGVLVLGAGLDRGGSRQLHGSIGWVDYWMTQFPVVVRYVRLSLWPHPLVFDYGIEGSGSPASLCLAILAVALLAGASAVAIRRGSAWGFLGAWFLAILAPTSIVAGSRQMAAEHRMYLALAPIAVAAAAGMAVAAGRFPKPAGRTAALAAATAVLALVLGAVTAGRNRVYGSELALWTDTVGARPANSFARINLGNAYCVLGRYAPALVQYAEAVRLTPADPDARNDYGACLLLSGNAPEAVRQLREAARLDPSSGTYRRNLELALSAAASRPAPRGPPP